MRPVIVKPLFSREKRTQDFPTLALQRRQWADRTVPSLSVITQIRIRVIHALWKMSHRRYSFGAKHQICLRFDLLRWQWIQIQFKYKLQGFPTVAGCKGSSPAPDSTKDQWIQQKVNMHSGFLSISAKYFLQINATRLVVQTSWDIQKLAKNNSRRFFSWLHFTFWIIHP